MKCPYEAISATGKIFCLHEDKKAKYCHLKNCPLNIEELKELLAVVGGNEFADEIETEVKKAIGGV